MTERDMSKYLSKCFVKISEEVISASTSERRVGGSKPLIYYSKIGHENILNYVTEQSQLHYYFKDTKYPQVLRLVDE